MNPLHIRPTMRQGFYHNSINNEDFKIINNHHSSDSSSHWCDTCDKGFESAFLLENHKRKHQKCNIDGCQFIAHPKVVTKHIQMQHATGLYKKISKLNDPEEIKKWREERKNKYPTKETIQRKAALIKEKIKRGEKMGFKNYKGKRIPFKSDNPGKNKKRVVSRNFQNSLHKIKQSAPNKRRDNIEFSKPEVVNICKIIPKESRTLKPFGGIQDLISNNSDTEEKTEFCNDDFIEDDEYLHDTSDLTETAKPQGPMVCGILTSLICNYGSTDDEEDDSEINTLELQCNINKKKLSATSVSKTNVVTNNRNTPPKADENKASKVLNKITPIKSQYSKIEKNELNEADDNSGPEETQILKQTLEDNDNENKYKSHKPTTNNDKQKATKHVVKNKVILRNIYKRKLPSSLLEKLLHKEIKKERNIVLQCIRHIIKNNYFDKK